MKGQIGKVESVLTWCEIDKLCENKDIRLESPLLSWGTQHSVSGAAQSIQPRRSIIDGCAHRPVESCSSFRWAFNVLMIFLQIVMRTGWFLLCWAIKCVANSKRWCCMWTSPGLWGVSGNVWKWAQCGWCALCASPWPDGPWTRAVIWDLQLALKELGLHQAGSWGVSRGSGRRAGREEWNSWQQEWKRKFGSRMTAGLYIII